MTKIARLTRLFNEGRFLDIIEIADSNKNLKKKFTELKLIGAAYLKLENFEDAYKCLEACHKLKPTDLSVINNFSYCLIMLGHNEIAWGLWKNYSPSNGDANYLINYGISALEIGKLKEAISAFMRYCIKFPSLNTHQDFLAQLWLQSPNLFTEESITLWQSSKAFREMKSIPTKVIQLIHFFRLGETNKCKEILDILNSPEAKVNYQKLNDTERLFVKAYTNLIIKLKVKNITPINNKITHIGESHCLSFTNQLITINGSIYQITPRPIIGAKAFHIASSQKNKFRAYFENHVRTSESQFVILSFGEIDCRENEGILKAAISGGELDLAENTSKAYVREAVRLCEGYGKSPIFFTVPSPIRQEREQLNDFELRRKIVEKFNDCIIRGKDSFGYLVLDIFKDFRDSGVSYDGRYHIDNRHLRRDALAQCP